MVLRLRLRLGLGLELRLGQEARAGAEVVRGLVRERGRGRRLTAASWPPRLAKAAAVSPCAFLRAGLAPAASSACTSSALPILAATISDVVLSSPVAGSGRGSGLRVRARAIG